MACGVPFTVVFLFAISLTSLNYAFSFEFKDDKEISRDRRDAIGPEEAIFYCTEVNFPEDIFCDFSSTTLARDEWKGLAPQKDGELVFFEGKVSIYYKFVGGDSLKRFQFQHVRLYPVEYEPPTRDVKMDQYSRLLMQSEKFTCFMQIEYIGKVCGNLGDKCGDEDSSLLEYKFINPGTSICFRLAPGRIVKDFFGVPSPIDQTRCRPTRKLNV